MIFWLALLAALGCAICNGVAAILEKVSADGQARAHSIQVGLLVRLLQQWPYVLGLVLDGIAWILTLVAVQSLPLFVVQPIIAFSVVVTAIVERFVLHRRLGRMTTIAIFVILSGLGLLALTAAPEKASVASTSFRWIIIFMPIALAVLGSMFVKIRKGYATIVLGAISGVAFGGTAVAGRMLTFSHPYWHVLTEPLLWAIIAYGLVGIMLFTIALQRNLATVVNATMITCETIFPLIVGIIFLGDRPRNGLWVLVISGVALALTGTALITAAHKEQVPQKSKAVI